MTAPFKELDTVVLERDVPEAHLRRGDLGAVVQVYGSEAVEVEFVTASGRTQALLTLPLADVRAVGTTTCLQCAPHRPPTERPNMPLQPTSGTVLMSTISWFPNGLLIRARG